MDNEDIQYREKFDYQKYSDLAKDNKVVAIGEVGLDYEQYVTVNPDFFRPGESVPLVGNAGRIKAELGWEPRISFEAMIRQMVRNDLKLLGG